MTCNIGAQLILDSKTINEKLKADVETLLRKTFKPEFLNRIDAIVFFNKLDQASIQAITALQLEELAARMRTKNIKIIFGDGVIEELTKRGYDQEFGARPLKRTIQEYVTVPLSQALLRNPDKKEFSISLNNGQFLVR
jgi:ATP-dependent Clp protease ATP-binding subunit ClpB